MTFRRTIMGWWRFRRLRLAICRRWRPRLRLPARRNRPLELRRTAAESSRLVRCDSAAGAVAAVRSRAGPRDTHDPQSAHALAAESERACARQPGYRHSAFTLSADSARSAVGIPCAHRVRGNHRHDPLCSAALELLSRRRHAFYLHGHDVAGADALLPLLPLLLLGISLLPRRVPSYAQWTDASLSPRF